jgi:Ca-activated chloride channel family protein
MKIRGIPHRIGVCMMVLVMSSAIAMAQSGRRPAATNPQNAGQDDTVRLRTDEVLLNITVTDPFGHQATDLTKNDFIIAEDGQRQDIASFQISRVPVNVVLLLDASGSVAGAISSLREAAMSFLDQLSPEDKVSVMEFHSDIELLQDWTSKADDVRHALSWRFKPGMVRTSEGHTQYGLTALYDAIYSAADEQLGKVQGRKAIVLLTDGDDTSSKLSYQQALAGVIQSGAMVYVVSKAQQFLAEIRAASGGKLGRVLGTGAQADRFIAEFQEAERIMTDLCTRSGGRIYSPLHDEEMKAVYAQVAQELKNQYIVTYLPKNDQRDGRLRQVKVFLTRSGYAARTREGYYAPRGP